MAEQVASGFVRFSEVWPVLQARLAADVQLQAMLGWDGVRPHVYRALKGKDHIPARERPEGTHWGRLVILPTGTMWGVQEDPLGFRPGQVRIRSEFPNVDADAWDPAVAHEAVQARVWELLTNWAPGARLDGSPLTFITLAVPFYRYSVPMDVPLWDGERGVSMTWTDWRFEGTPATVWAATIELTPAPAGVVLRY